MKVERMIMMGIVGVLNLGCRPAATHEGPGGVGPMGMPLGPNLSVIYPELEIAEAERPSSGFRPEVLLLVVEGQRSPDDDLRVPVKQFKDVLRLGECSSRAVCRRLLDRFGEQWTVWGQHACTGTFVAADQIVTAAHCLKYTMWEQTYAITGFDADHGWTVEDGVMTIPASNVIPLCHAEVCEKQMVDGQYVSDFALVHACPEAAKRVTPPFRRLLADGPVTDLEGLEVYSHAWGLPLKRYQAIADPERSVAMFTNAGGGSGSALANRHGEVIAITSGRTDELSHIACPSGSPVCSGQTMTWYFDIHRFVEQQVLCGYLSELGSHAPNTCAASTSDGPK